MRGLPDDPAQVLCLAGRIRNFQNIPLVGVDEGGALVGPHPRELVVIAHVDMTVDQVFGVVLLDKLPQGGKAVAALYGFLFALWVCAGYTPWVFFLPLITFLLVLTVSKIVSLSSILSSLAAAFFMWVIHAHVSVILAVGIFSALIIVRHHGNIRRMISGTERKISWMK